MPDARLVVTALPHPGETVLLEGAELSHARARRLRAGDRLTLVDGSGREAAARVASIRGTTLEAVVEEIRRVEALEPDLTVFVAGLRLARLSWIVEKAAELGVARVSIVQTAHTQPFRARESLERLARVAREAAKQCGSARWPACSGPFSLRDVVENERAGHRLLLDPGGEPLPAALSPAAAALLVGPEGGFTGRERELAAENGWRSTSLPAGRLRAETAAVAGVVLVRAALERGSHT